MNKEVELLKIARDMIECEDERFICHAVVWSAYYKKGYHAAGKRVADFISRSLNGHYTLDAWLEVVAGVHYSKLTAKRMREYRLRYIDHLIKEFS